MMTGVETGRAWTLQCCVLALMLVAGVIGSLLNRFIFFPEAELIGTPADLSMEYEEIRFQAADGTRLHGWFVPGPRRETILWFHGNAGNISHRLENLRLLHDTVGASVFLFDYRQYGRSEGTASEKGLYDDARGALAALRARSDVRHDRIVYFGRSIGSAVAIDLATTEPPLGMVLESPFMSMQAMAATLLPGPLAAVLPRGFDNIGKIETIRCPTLFIHGDRDDIVPYSQGRALFAAANPPKAFYTIRGAGHNDTYVAGGAKYFQRFREFLDGL